MNWIPISEKPKKDGWYIGWGPGCSIDGWDPIKWSKGRWLDNTGFTHWLEITGPEDVLIQAAADKLRRIADEKFIIELAKEVNCLPSFFVGENQHIIEAVKKLKSKPKDCCGWVIVDGELLSTSCVIDEDIQQVCGDIYTKITHCPNCGRAIKEVKP